MPTLYLFTFPYNLNGMEHGVSDTNFEIKHLTPYILAYFFSHSQTECFDNSNMENIVIVLM